MHWDFYPEKYVFESVYVKGKTAVKSKKRIIVLNDFFRGEDVLFFYDKKKDFEKVFRTVVEPFSKQNGTSTLYAYPRESDKVDQADSYNGKLKFHHFPILDRKYKKLFTEDIDNFASELKKFFGKVRREKGSGVKLFIDFENTVTAENIDEIVSLKKRSTEEYDDLKINLIYAFDINSLTDELTQRLAEISDKFIITSGGDYTILSPIRKVGAGEAPQLESIAYEDIEDRVKKSLDVIIYSILQNSSLCGFNIIKNIVQNFNVLLSQGTVYPILYDLTKKGYLKVETQKDNRTRVYSVTEEGAVFFKAKIQSFIDAQSRVMSFIQNQARPVYDK